MLKIFTKFQIHRGNFDKWWFNFILLYFIEISNHLGLLRKKDFFGAVYFDFFNKKDNSFVLFNFSIETSSCCVVCMADKN